ncbi:head maturation protease, ClpP-related [Paracoccus zhejiangensis]|uniref:ATP-dependent Clp protease proteolytic subunit n=1 Tax=Paracoccus zhejiangensis TaxID=1077935 RepID=A0A2H5EUC6_9RHOB|nr:head maturation protease, ClpP-related [Paracoccus zhejiangensis]AUH62900.1 peptidase [Paracoccus zhejiangensis]
MSLRDLPAGPVLPRPAAFQADAPSDALVRWAEMPVAVQVTSVTERDSTITIFDVIGEDDMGGGVSLRRIAAALSRIGPQAVTVQINSPGGDMFEGIAIYNLLRAHPAAVTVEVLGLAASAASIIAMAGDEIHMSPGSFLMLHNAWGVVIGNRHDMAEAATLFETFDAALTGIYAARSGRSSEEIAALLDAETFLGTEEAIAAGMADGIAPDTGNRPRVEAEPPTMAQARPDIQARRRIDAALAQQGIPRSERRAMLKQITGTRNAAEPATQNAGIPVSAIRRLIDTIRS